MASNEIAKGTKWARFHWFDRTFGFPIPIELFPDILERLRGTPARLEERLADVDDAATRARFDDAWSIRENVGHLTDLEPLWTGRVDDLRNEAGRLRPADLQNRTTHQAGHNDFELDRLLTDFRAARAALMARLDAFSPENADLTALHPRLDRSMTIVDHAFFVAEHDDHHLATIAGLLARADEPS
jgi:uncharacterized damage-inducible protein DinB